MTHPLNQLGRLTGDHLRKQDYSGDDDRLLAYKFADEIDSAISSSLVEQELSKIKVRGLKHATSVLSAYVPGSLSRLFKSANEAFNQVRWTEFYQADDWSEGFLGEFANGEGIGPDGVLYHPDIILGLFILGPHTIYPEHAHPADEFYIVLSGKPEFKVGANSEYLVQEPGSVVLHHSDTSHSIRTRKDPFFGVFGWRGEIHAPSWYREDMNDIKELKKHPTYAKS